MEKTLLATALCALASACSTNVGTTEYVDMTATNLPQECRYGFSQWDASLEKIRSSGRFSNETMDALVERRNFAARNIRNAPEKEEQRQACAPLGRMMDEQLIKIENIQNMSQQELDHEFGVDRLIRKKKQD